jgi:hypothetical protein
LLKFYPKPPPLPAEEQSSQWGEQTTVPKPVQDSVTEGERAAGFRIESFIPEHFALTEAKTEITERNGSTETQFAADGYDRDATDVALYAYNLFIELC